MKACSDCGASNSDDALFCLSCNHFLDWTESSSEPAIIRSSEVDHPAAVSPTPPAPVAPVVAVVVPAIAPAASTPGVAAAQPARRSPQVAPSVLTMAISALECSRQLAQDRSRTDLIAQLDDAEQRIGRRTIDVAVVGEFKRGKSTLVNALLQTAVCPVDADVVTIVPTVVRYGPQPVAIAYVEASEEGGEPLAQTMSLASVGEFVSESGNPGNKRRLRSVEVRLPHRMLRSGLSLVDTPGVGGLDSAHGIITLGALDQAQGIIFVTDASTELTKPELDFLKLALQRCPLAACVVTKTDLYPQWRRIVELDESHLRAAGLEIPVIPVSSFLRLRASRRPELSGESGFAELVSFLGRQVAAKANLLAADAAGRAVDFVASQLNSEVEAEQAVLAEPAQAQQVVAELAGARNRAARLASPTATWQQVLSDGVQDLVSNVQHDLQERLRAVLREVEGVIERGDPKDSWDDIEVWLRRQVVSAAIANYDALAAQATELADDVAQGFNLEAGPAWQLEKHSPPSGLESPSLASVETLKAPGGRLGSMLMATRTAVFIPMVLFGVAGSLLGAVIVAPLSVALAAGIGQKLIRDERKRQVTHRRQQAKMAARRYVEEVGFIMNKETQDALRRTQRTLRDDFQLRAGAIHRSSVSALGAASQAMQLPPAERASRAADLAAESARLQQVRSDAWQLAQQPAGQLVSGVGVRQ